MTHPSLPSLVVIPLLAMVLAPSVVHGEFICAGHLTKGQPPHDAVTAAKPLQRRTDSMEAVALYAAFRGDDTADQPAPAWSGGLLDPDKPGSFSHFYRTMSFERFHPLGQVAPRWYEARHSAGEYMSPNPQEVPAYGEFCRDILAAADDDMDFSLFDSDGPDGVPNSGDDDGVVDAVFVVLDHIPHNFIRGDATGVAGLGLEEDWVTSDAGADGQMIRIASAQGAVLQGRSFAETAGIMCHEYGHVLGLPDLYNIEFLRQSSLDPAYDSAGIGRWGLMGWGAAGWQDDDGPTSFCAWSRAALGWATVREISQVEEELHLPEVGRAGDVYKVPVGTSEHFMLEYRRRTSTYYDRHLPAEGLLIWHRDMDRLDLECADGLWRGAGYPMGTVADLEGGDNLDFWAHDAAYTERHAGNQGDATDPFDGVRYTAFTAGTNPASHNLRRTRSIEIEGIRLDGDTALAHLRVLPMYVEVENLRVADASGDGILTSGEQADLVFYLVNKGGLVARNTHVELTTEDALVQIVNGDASFGDVGVGRASGQPTDGGFPSIRLVTDFAEPRSLSLSMGVYVEDSLVVTQSFQVQAVYSHRVYARVVDERGEGVPGIDVNLTRQDNRRTFRLTSNEHGDCETELPPAAYSYTTDAGEAMYAQTSGSFTIGGDTGLEIILPDGFEVSGVTRDAAGSPVGGVRVTAVGGGGWVASVTGQEGGYRLVLPRGRQTLSAYRYSETPEGRYPTQLLEELDVDGPVRFDVVISSGVSVEVSVVDAEGIGLGGASLLARQSYLAGSMSHRADEAGLVKLNLFPGMYRLMSSSSSSGRGRFVQAALPVVAISSDTTLRLELQRTAPLTGTLSDRGARPHFAAYLGFSPLDAGRHEVAAIATDGTYEVDLVPGKYQVSLIPDGLGSTPSQVLDTVIVSGEATAHFVTDPGVPITGRVSALPGEFGDMTDIIATSSSARASARAAISADGSFELYLKPGRYGFTAARGGSSFWSLGEAEVQVGDQLVLHRSGGASLSGMVQNSRGQPIGRAIVVLAQQPLALTGLNYRSDLVGVFSDDPGAVAAAESDGGGLVELPATPGEYSAIVLPPYAEGLGIVYDASLRGNLQQSLVMPDHDAYHEIYGRVIVEPGVPRDDAILLFYCRATGVILQHNNRDSGAYLLRLPPGRYEVRAGLSDPGYGFYRTYDLGALTIDRDRQWDIRLDPASTAIAESEAALPSAAMLLPNYPNPFNPSTTIRYRLPDPALVEVTVFDVLGRQVLSWQRPHQAAGHHNITWHGNDSSGREAATGVYFCRLSVTSPHGHSVDTSKLLLLR